MADSDLDNAGVKAVITLGVLAFVGILAFVISKIVQFCVNKHYTDDDGGDIDENTRDLIRARLSVVQFKKREIKKAQRERTINIFTKWKDIVNCKQKDREEALKSQRPQKNGQVVITIDKVDALNLKENGVLENESNKIKENGTPRIARFPFFAQTKTAVGNVKPHSETPRTTPLLKTNSVTPEAPVPRGRPVSSKQRTLPNVKVTEVDVNSSAKVHLKSVHFEEVVENVKTKSENDTANSKTGPTVEKTDNVKGHTKVDEKETVKGKTDNGKKDKEVINVKAEEEHIVENKTESDKNDKVNTNQNITENSISSKAHGESNGGTNSDTIAQHSETVGNNTTEKSKRVKVTYKLETETKSGEKT